MAKGIDVRGFSCPLPVMLVKKAMDQGERDITVIADDPMAVGNIRRQADDNQFAIEVEKRGGDTLLKLRKQA